MAKVSRRLKVILATLGLLVLVFSLWAWLSRQRYAGLVYSKRNPGTGTASRWRRIGPSGKIRERDGRRYLWGGREKQHFDITEFRLRPERLHHGMGRETFPALINPEFESAEEASHWLTDSSRVLGVSINRDARVYPVKLLLRYEVVNDVVGERPVFACYCTLADYAAVYERTMAGHVFTFGVSGYTYGEENIRGGRDAFVLWDRDTESLWWPLINRGVSGPAVDQPMKLTDRAFWEDTTWGQFRAKHPNARVLRRGQDFERPKQWPRYTGSFQEPTPGRDKTEQSGK